MAVQTTEEFKNGGATSYAITIEYLKESDIKVRIDGALQTYVASGPSTGEYTVSGTTVTLGAQAAAGTGNVHIYRETDVNTAAAVFSVGSSIRAQDLNAIHDMARFSAVEHRNQVISADIKDGQVTTAKIAADNITSALIADDQIDSEHYVADSIDSEHYAPNSVDSAAIGPLQVTTNELDNDAVTAAKIADDAIQTEHYSDNSIARAHMQNNIVNGDKLDNNAVGREHVVDGEIIRSKIAGDAIDGTKLADNAVNTEHITNGSIDSTKLSGATVITSTEQGSATTNDTSFLTSAAADARFFNISSGDTVKDGDPFPDNDTTIATTAAINDRIIDLVDDVGGFVPIANETSFPTTNPDINLSGSAKGGTIISVTAASTNLVPSGSPATTVTITNGRGTGLPVVITGVPETIPQNYGFLVETTATDHTYAFHRLIPRATEVTTLAGISGNITTVAGISANTTTVAGISSDVTTVAGIASDVTAVANNNTNITAVKNNETNINAVKNNETNINTVATANTAVNTVSTNIASVNNASANISSINNFGDTYQVASSNPSTDGGGNAVAEGDLYFNTSANRLKVYNGTDWVDGVIASGGGAQTTGDTFTGDLKLNDNVNLIVGTGDDLKIFHQSSNSKNYIQGSNTQTILQAKSGESSIVMNPDGGVDLYHDDIKKFETTSAGVTVTGNISLTGNVDGRDLAVDGAKLDAITANAIADLVEDTSPQLGGNLDTNSHNIYIDDDHKVIWGDNQSADLQIFHESSSGSGNIYNATGQLRLRSDDIRLKNLGNTETYLRATNNGNVELYYDNIKKFETTSTGITVSGKVGIPDGSSSGAAVTLGNSGDLKLYHDGTDSYIENSTGDLKYKAAAQQFIGSNDETMIIANQNGAVELYYNNVKKLYTYVDGAKVEGDFVFKQADGTTKASWSGSASRINVKDSTKFTAGDGDDLQLYHNGTDSYIDNTNGNLAIRTTGATHISLKTNNENAIYCGANGAVQLYYDNNKKFETLTNGVRVTGNIELLDAGADIRLQNDNGKLICGAGSDLLIYHDGTKSYIDNNTGDLEIVTPSRIELQGNNGSHTMARFTSGGAVELFHNNSNNCGTSSTGFTIAGNRDIRFDNGSWTGNSTKIQHHNNSLYVQGGSGTYGIMFRDHDGLDRWSVLDTGHWYPMLDSTYDIGSNSQRVRNIYADTLYGDGSNLTGVDPTIADGCIYENNQTISSTVSTSSSKNSFAAGDITITGTLTVANNTTFVIL